MQKMKSKIEENIEKIDTFTSNLPVPKDGGKRFQESHKREKSVDTVY